MWAVHLSESREPNLVNLMIALDFDFDEDDSFDDDDVYNHNDSEASSKTECWSIDLLWIAPMMKGCFRPSVTNSIWREQIVFGV